MVTAEKFPPIRKWILKKGEEIQQLCVFRYGLGEQAEADESTELIFVNLDSIVRNAVDEEIKQSMAVHLKGGMALFRDYLMKSGLNV